MPPTMVQVSEQSSKIGGGGEEGDVVVDKSNNNSNHLHSLSVVPPGDSEPQILEYMNISDYSLQTRSAVPIARPLFQPFPPTITFEGYEALETYTATLCLRNIDTVARRVKVLPLPSLVALR